MRHKPVEGKEEMKQEVMWDELAMAMYTYSLLKQTVSRSYVTPIR
jgi:hypothetical protein